MENEGEPMNKRFTFAIVALSIIIILASCAALAGVIGMVNQVNPEPTATTEALREVTAEEAPVRLLDPRPGLDAQFTQLNQQLEGRLNTVDYVGGNIRINLNAHTQDGNMLYLIGMQLDTLVTMCRVRQSSPLPYNSITVVIVDSEGVAMMATFLREKRDTVVWETMGTEAIMTYAEPTPYVRKSLGSVGVPWPHNDNGTY